MPKKSSSSQNAFSFFMHDLRNRQGRNIRSMAEAADIAGPLWAGMSAQQRKPYEDMAKKAKNAKGRLTTTGRDVELLQKQENAHQESIANMRADINNIIDELYECGVLDKTFFFIAHINNFCYCESKNKWYPAEIACTGFSLREGVLQPKNVFHSLIKPGPLPIGYGSNAKQHSSQTHQLELPSSDENNCEKVFSDLITFLDERVKERKIIIYANENKLQMISDVIEMWCADFNIPLNTILVYNLQYFFTTLRNKCAGDIVWHSDTFSCRELEKDLYDFSPNIACELHEVASSPVHCSRSITIRSAYIICDNCCPSLNIKCIRGFHIPLDSKKAGTVQKVESKPNSVPHSRKSNVRSSRDDDSSTFKSYGKSEWETQSYCSTLDDFPTADETHDKSKDIWEKFYPNMDCSQQMSYAGAMGAPGGVRTASSGHGISQVDVSAAIGNLSLRDNEVHFPQLGAGRGIRKGKLLARGRGSVYDKK